MCRYVVESVIADGEKHTIEKSPVYIAMSFYDSNSLGSVLIAVNQSADLFEDLFPGSYIERCSIIDFYKSVIFNKSKIELIGEVDEEDFVISLMPDYLNRNIVYIEIKQNNSYFYYQAVQDRNYCYDQIDPQALYKIGKNEEEAVNFFKEKLLMKEEGAGLNDIVGRKLEEIHCHSEQNAIIEKYALLIRDNRNNVNSLRIDIPHDSVHIDLEYFVSNNEEFVTLHEVINEDDMPTAIKFYKVVG